MTTYPDADDATNAKRGSDRDLAECWRILAIEARYHSQFHERRAEMWKRIALTQRATK